MADPPGCFEWYIAHDRLSVSVRHSHANRSSKNKADATAPRGKLKSPLDISVARLSLPYASHASYDSHLSLPPRIILISVRTSPAAIMELCIRLLALPAWRHSHYADGPWRRRGGSGSSARLSLAGPEGERKRAAKASDGFWRRKKTGEKSSAIWNLAESVIYQLPIGNPFVIINKNTFLCLWFLAGALSTS